MEEKKIIYLESLRFAACFFVVVRHVASNDWYGGVGTFAWGVMTAYIGISTFAVPVFFMISGALFLNPNKDFSIKKLFLNNVLKCFLFLIFWGFVYQLYSTYTENGFLTRTDMLVAVRNVMKADTQIHLWFVYAIIGLYLTAPLLRVTVQKLSESDWKYFLLVFFVFSGIACFFSNFDFPFAKNLCRWLDKFSVSSFVGYSGYFLLGYYLSVIEIKKSRRNVLYVLGIFGLCLSVALTFLQSYAKKVPFAGFFENCSFLIVLYSVSVFVFFRYALNRKTCAFVRSGANSSFGIYGIHMLVLFLLWKAGLTTLNHTLAAVPLISALVFMISFASVRAASELDDILCHLNFRFLSRNRMFHPVLCMAFCALITFQFLPSRSQIFLAELPDYPVSRREIPHYIDSFSTDLIRGWAYNNGQPGEIFYVEGDKVYKAMPKSRIDVQESFGLETDAVGFEIIAPNELNGGGIVFC